MIFIKVALCFSTRTKNDVLSRVLREYIGSRTNVVFGQPSKGGFSSSGMYTNPNYSWFPYPTEYRNKSIKWSYLILNLCSSASATGLSLLATNALQTKLFETSCTIMHGPMYGHVEVEWPPYILVLRMRLASLKWPAADAGSALNSIQCPCMPPPWLQG